MKKSFFLISVLAILGLACLPLFGFVDSSGNQVQPEVISKTEAAVTDGADGTYTYYIDTKTFNKVGIQLILDPGSDSITVTIEATMQDDGTAQASCAYTDVTEAVFGSATFTASAMLIDDTGALALARYVKIKVVASTGDADDADWTIYTRKIQ